MMKKLTLAALSFAALMSATAQARDTVSAYNIADFLKSDLAKEKLGTQVAFYFGEQKHPAVVKNMGEFRTNKKTNAFNKSDKEACEWAFLSAMISLRDRALQEGANAVINIKSNYRNNLTSSNDTFQCGAGAVMAGVALVGDVVKTK